MKKIILLFCLMYQMISAQNKRFIYEYSFIPDSTNRANIVKDLMFLDISNGRSLFYSRYKFTEDSTSIAESEKKKFYIPKADILYRIEKKDGKVFFKTNDYGLGKIKVEDDQKMDWNVLPEKQKIGEYIAQKATVSFGGRTWIAWFTADIPIQDGPYKFNGLPGLIIKIEDAAKNHRYELVGIRNTIGETLFPELRTRSNELVLTREKFIDLYKKYRENPAAETRQLYMEGRIPDQRDTSGNFRTGAEIVREVEQLARERIKKDNNVIEIDLLKSVQ